VISEVQGRLSSRLQQEARTDPLTGAANRRAWEAVAERELARAARSGEPVTIALLDLDHFKEVNDRRGHGAGDALLCELVTGWRGRLRSGDVLGRIGGDEFALCLPGTDAAGAGTLFERLTDAHPFTWSTGAATGSGTDTLQELLARADAELYAAKRTRSGNAVHTVVELTG
jgi:diguanylate cyclase (GGDEF)-like protein